MINTIGYPNQNIKINPMQLRYTQLHQIRLGLLIALMLAVPHATAHPGASSRILSLDEQIAQQPKNGYLLIKRAQEYIQEDKNYQPALRDLSKAKTLGTNETNSHEYNFVMGLYHQSQHQFKKAIPFFERCIELDINHLQCHRALAEVAQAQQQPRQAIARLSHFISQSENSEPDDYFHLAQLLVEDNQADLAIQYLDQAQARFGILPHFEKLAISIETSRKNFKQALARHQSLHPYFGKTPKWHYDRGVLLQNLGHSAQAKSSYEHALATLKTQKKKKNPASDTLQQEIQAKLASLKL